MTCPSLLFPSGYIGLPPASGLDCDFCFGQHHEARACAGRGILYVYTEAGEQCSLIRGLSVALLENLRARGGDMQMVKSDSGSDDQNIPVLPPFLNSLLDPLLKGLWP